MHGLHQAGPQPPAYLDAFGAEGFDSAVQAGRTGRPDAVGAR